MAATACIHHRLRREYRQYEHTILFVLLAVLS